MNTLLPDYIIISDSPDYSGRVLILANCIADSDADLPTLTEYQGFTLSQGSKCTLCTNGEKYIVDSGGTWSLIEKSPFQDVYTKSQIDSMISDIHGDINDIQDVNVIQTQHIEDLQEYDENQDKYIYALVGRSDLNLLDATVWEGQTPAGAGYVCQNLAINLPPGTYIWRMTRNGNTSTSFVLRAADDTELYRVTRGAGVNDIVQEFTITGTATKISIYVGYSITYYDNMIYFKR